MPIQRQISDQWRQLRVFFAQVPELPQFIRPQAGVFPFPPRKRLLGDPHSPADFPHRRPAFGRPQGSQDLRVGLPPSSCPRRVLLLDEEDHALALFRKLPVAYFSGFGSRVHDELRGWPHN